MASCLELLEPQFGFVTDIISASASQSERNPTVHLVYIVMESLAFLHEKGRRHFVKKMAAAPLYSARRREYSLSRTTNA